MENSFSACGEVFTGSGVLTDAITLRSRVYGVRLLGGLRSPTQSVVTVFMEAPGASWEACGMMPSRGPGPEQECGAEDGIRTRDPLLVMELGVGAVLALSRH